MTNGKMVCLSGK